MSWNRACCFVRDFRHFCEVLIEKQDIFAVTDSENTMPKHLSPDILAALKGVRFIAQHIKDADKDNEVSL